MKCEECQKLLWDFDECSESEQKIILEHLAVCPECRETLSLIKKVQNASASLSISVADKTIARLEKEKKPLYSSFLKYSLVASVVIVASLIFLLPTLSTKTADHAENASVDYKTESVTDGAVGTTWEDNLLFDRVEMEEAEDFAPEAPLDKEYCENEPISSPDTTVDEPMEVPEADVQMLINLYKDTFLISSHTSDVVLSGVDINDVCKLLSSLSPVLCDTHVEIETDVLSSVLLILESANIFPIYTTSSETVLKTVIYFEENLK